MEIQLTDLNLLKIFKSRIHFKSSSFNDNISMERLLSVLDGDGKKSVEVLGTSRTFYAKALKFLKRDYENPLVIAHLRFKALFFHPQLKVFDQSSLKTVSRPFENK